MNKTKSIIALALAGLLASSAMAAPLNPLVRPNSAPPGAAQLQGPRVPPPPSAPALAQPAGGAQDQGAGKDSNQGGVAGARATLARFTVVSIVGEMAALRMIPNLIPMATGGQGQGQGQGGFGQQPGAGGAGAAGGAGGAGGTQGGQGNAAAQAKVYPSLLIKNNQAFMLNDIELLPQITDSQVWVRTKDGSRVVFYSRLDSRSINDHSKTLKPEATDAAYVTRYSPTPAGFTSVQGGTTGGTNGGSGASGSGTGGTGGTGAGSAGNTGTAK